MQRTLFNTPVLKYFLRGLSLLLLKILGWKAVGQLPAESKFVLIFAWHTSNWDVFYGVLVAFALKLEMIFLAKKELFRHPFKPLVKYLGGIPIERKESNHIVDQMIRVFDENEKFILAISPEGTRRKVQYWKSGFYHIAQGAHVPVLLTFLDYEQKKGGAGPLMYLTGNIDRDMEAIRNFYATVKGKYPEKASAAAIRHEQKI
jgi:1-acyl-sn-glycerol-3-phosphate acyltransferase